MIDSSVVVCAYVMALMERVVVILPNVYWLHDEADLPVLINTIWFDPDGSGCVTLGVTITGDEWESVDTEVSYDPIAQWGTIDNEDPLMVFSESECQEAREHWRELVPS